MTEEQDLEVGEQEINVLEMLQLLAKKKIFIIAVCTTVAIASAAYSLTLPNIYSSSAKVLPPQKESSGGLSALLGSTGGLAGLAGGLTGGTDLFIGILKSRSVSDAVIQRLDLVKAYKAGTIEATRPIVDAAVKAQAGTDGIIVISAEDKDPTRAAQLANAFAYELGRTTVRLNLTKVGNEKLFLEKRLEVVKSELKAAEEDMKDFFQKNKIVAIDSQMKASFDGIGHLKSELASKEVMLSVLRASQTEQSAEVKALRAGIHQLQGEMAQLQGRGDGAQGIPALGNVPSLGLEYARKMRELKTREAVFEQLSKQYEMAKLNEAKDSSSFQIVDDAIPSSVKIGPKRSRIVLLATIIAFFASVFIVLVRDRMEKMSEESRKAYCDIKRELLSFTR